MVRYGLSSKKKAAFLLKQGNSVKKVNLMTKISIDTLKKISAELKRSKLPPNGRPLKSTPKIEAFILSSMKKVPQPTPNQLSKTIKELFQVSLCAATVKNVLKRNRYKSKKQQKKPLLSNINKRKRLAFAKKYRNWKSDDWMQVIWSDESSFTRVNSKKSLWYWHREGDDLRCCPSFQQGGGSLMIWGCISAQGHGILKFLENTMTSDSYIEVLNHEMKQSLDAFDVDAQDIFFQQDNAPCHSSKKVKQWFQQNKIPLLAPWPPQSPDLNPIEHVWKHLKNQISCCRSLNELKIKIEEAWEKLDPEICYNLIESMPRRIQAVIKAKGGCTKY